MAKKTFRLGPRFPDYRELIETEKEWQLKCIFQDISLEVRSA